MNYKQLVEAVTDELLTEIMKVSLQAPTSRNALYAVRYGDFMKKLRYELDGRGFPGADRVSVEPVPHGQSRIMTSVVDTPTIKRVAFATKKGVPEVEDALKHDTVIGLEPAHSDGGGLGIQAGVLAHEAGHAIANHPYNGMNSARGQAEVDRETEAWDIGTEFAQHAGLDADVSMRDSALNKYRADNSLPSAPEDPAAARMWNKRAQRKIDSDDDPSTILVGKKRVRGMQNLTAQKLNAFLARHEK